VRETSGGGRERDKGGMVVRKYPALSPRQIPQANGAVKGAGGQLRSGRRKGQSPHGLAFFVSAQDLHVAVPPGWNGALWQPESGEGKGIMPANVVPFLHSFSIFVSGRGARSR